MDCSNTILENTKIRWFALFFAVQGVVLTGVAVAISYTPLSVLGEGISSELLVLLAYLGVLFWMILVSRTGIRDFFGILVFSSGRHPAGILEILLLSVMLALFSISMMLVEWIPFSFIFPDYIQDLLEDSRLFHWDRSVPDAERFLANSLVLLLLLFWAPLVEELLFRGWLLARLTFKWGRIVATLLSSFVFAALHFDILGALMFGVVMCVLYYRTGSLRAGIIVHFLNNLWATLIVFGIILVNGEELVYSLEEFRAQWPIFLSALLISLPLLGIWFKRNWHILIEHREKNDMSMEAAHLTETSDAS